MLCNLDISLQLAVSVFKKHKEQENHPLYKSLRTSRFSKGKFLRWGISGPKEESV